MTACEPDTFGQVNYEAATTDEVSAYAVGPDSTLNVDTSGLAGVGDFGFGADNTRTDALLVLSARRGTLFYGGGVLADGTLPGKHEQPSGG